MSIFKSIWRFILAIFNVGHELTEVDEKLNPSALQDPTIDDIQAKSELFSKAIDDEKKRVNDFYKSELKKMEDEKGQLEDLILKLKENAHE